MEEEEEEELVSVSSEDETSTEWYTDKKENLIFLIYKEIQNGIFQM